ncbi:MAG: hypothetical protein ISS49_03540 [Anaerolineae bacterium]|nr:hypothetical protein [Anaerolineae bacterium]
MDERQNRNGGWSRLKIFAGLVVMAFAVTLAVIVGNRLSDEALAVLAGAVCGVGAAIPTSLLVVAVTRRRDERRDFGCAQDRPSRATQPSMPQGVYPPVVVVTPPGGQQQPGAWNALPPSATMPIQRHFTVVGGLPVDVGAMPPA